MDPKRRDKISDLPRELLVMIIEKTSRSHKLAAVRLVSKLFNDIATPLLFQKVVLKCLNSSDPSFIEFVKEVSHLDPVPHLKHTRKLEFRTDTKYYKEHCWHDIPGEKIIGTEGEIQEIRKHSPANFFRNGVLTFCQHLASDTLRSFSWHLASCVSNKLLGPEGYLCEHQSSLRELSLVTSLECKTHRERATKYDLSAFKHLRAFSWVGPRTYHDFLAIRDCLGSNAQYLESITLELVGVDHWRLNSSDHSPTITIEDIFLTSLDQHIGPATARFPMLRSLSMSQIFLGDDEDTLDMLTKGLSFSQLETLKFFHCPVISILLYQLAKARRCGQLKHLEVSIFDTVDPYIGDETDVIPFLDSLSTLEDVFLMLSYPGWDAIIASIRHLSPMPRGVVLYQRDFDTVGDIIDGSLHHSSGLRELLMHGSCDVLGFSYDLDELRKDLGSDAARVTCKLLHIRSTGNQLFCGMNKVDGFATWIFGPQGITGLLLLAFGDFSYDKDNRELYCRNDDTTLGRPPFRRLRQTDTALWDLIQQNRDALAACPYRSLRTDRSSL